jgi:ubiquinone/menaquinone biosynthesis C-methylase UbiE
MAVERLAPAERDDLAWIEREAIQARAYDAMGARYDEAFPHKDGQLACVERLLEHVGAGARVLDVGCGTGLPTARQLVAAGCSVTCLDISPGMLELAQRNVPDAAFQLGDVLDIPDGPPAFEGVVAFFSLLNLPRARMRTALRRIHSILIPDGWFGLAMVEADVDDVSIPFLGTRLRVTGYLRDDLRELLRECGFYIGWEQLLSYAPETSAAQPEMQMFFLCRRLDGS